MNQIFNADCLRENLEFNEPEILLSLYSDYIDQLYSLSEYIKNINQTIDEEVKSGLKCELHKIKSSSKAIGALTLGEKLDYVEKKIDNLEANEISLELNSLTLLINETRKKILDESADLVKRYM